MPYSDLQKNDASGVPSLFASSGTSNRHRTDGTSYLNKKRSKSKGPDRRKVNILALVDGAIEDGATDQAKQKAFAERTASAAPVPQMRRTIPPKKSLSLPAVRKTKDTTLDSEKDNKFVRSFDRPTRDDSHKSNNNAPDLDSKSSNSHTPAWKARLNKQGRKSSDDKQLSPKTRTKSPKPGKKAQRKKNSEQKFSLDNSKAFELPLSRDEKPFQPKELPPLKTGKYGPYDYSTSSKKERKDKKEKKEKKKKKKKKDNSSSHKSVHDGEEYSGHEESESNKSIVDEEYSTADLKIKVDHEESISSINHESVIFRNTYIPAKIVERDTKVAGTPRSNVRKNLEEAQNQMINVVQGAKQELSDMEKDFIASKETIRFQFMKNIHAQEKKTDVKYQEYKKVLDEKQKEIDELRAANQRIRTTIQKMPKQMSEVVFSNQSLEDANEEVANHTNVLEKFSKKLKADQNKLLRSSDKCKNQYLPRYRQQLWESGLHLESEKKIKSLYRDCMIKITKQVEKCRQVDLIEEISSLVLETEGEVNPKFDPGFLSSGSDSGDSTSSDSSDSSSSSSSSDSEY